MLAEFQQALADLTASPSLCLEARADPAVLRDRYDLTDREWQRIVGIVRDPGMECALVVYRANRLAPLAMNVPDLCRALGPRLRDIVDAFWLANPETNVHFFVETERFCRFVQALVERGEPFPAHVITALVRDSARIAAALAESHTEDQPPIRYVPSGV